MILLFGLFLTICNLNSVFASVSFYVHYTGGHHECEFANFQSNCRYVGLDENFSDGDSEQLNDFRVPNRMLGRPVVLFVEGGPVPLDQIIRGNFSARSWQSSPYAGGYFLRSNIRSSVMNYPNVNFEVRTNARVQLHARLNQIWIVVGEGQVNPHAGVILEQQHSLQELGKTIRVLKVTSPGDFELISENVGLTNTNRGQAVSTDFSTEALELSAEGCADSSRFQSTYLKALCRLVNKNNLDAFLKEFVLTTVLAPRTTKALFQIFENSFLSLYQIYNATDCSEIQNSYQKRKLRMLRGLLKELIESLELDFQIADESC